MTATPARTHPLPPTERRQKAIGALIGSALGDAVGELAFTHDSREALRAAIDALPVLRYTDDTAMAIALAESLLACGRLDPHHLGDTFRTHFRREPWRGYGPGPPRIFAMVEKTGMDYEQAAASLYGGAGSLGNGAAMRIAPLALFAADSPDLAAAARMSARVTHTHPVGIDGAVVQALAVAAALHLDPRQPFAAEAFIQGLLAQAQTPQMQQKLQLLQNLVAADTPPPQAAPALGMSVAVHESLPFALYSFLTHTHDFAACIECAVLHGGDRDTMGAMAGAVCGAFLGLDAIPFAWRSRLENARAIADLAGRLMRHGS